MANKYPYVSSSGPLLRAITHLRRSFPKEVTSETLRKLGVAPKNESYVINVLRFLKVINDEGKQDTTNKTVFLQHQEEAFANAFEKLVKESYSDLFELHGDDAWNLDQAALTHFFRTSDHTTDVVGRRQAGTFIALAGLSGHPQVSGRKESTPSKRARPTATEKKRRESKGKTVAEHTKINSNEGESTRQVGLSVRIEVNLPADGDQQTYDRIFRSIRKNLIDGE